MIAIAKETCMVPGCDQESHCRGICKSDWMAANRLVKREETTWEELESMGLSRPPCRKRSQLAIQLDLLRVTNRERAKQETARQEAAVEG